MKCPFNTPVSGQIEAHHLAHKRDTLLITIGSCFLTVVDVAFDADLDSAVDLFRIVQKLPPAIREFAI